MIVSVTTMALAAGLMVTYSSPASAATIEVGTYAELTEAIASADPGDTISIQNDITVENQVSIAKELTLDGNGHSISVPDVGVLGSGMNNPNPSQFRVFSTSGAATIQFEDMTIMGGSAEGAGLRNEGATTEVILKSVSISNGRNPEGGGGGITNAGTMRLSDSSVLRNSAVYGGGFLNNGTMFVDGSTFSENRSEDSSGGGGAGELLGRLFINNSTFSNNQSTEIGGALNIRSAGRLRAVNTSFTGNVAYGSYGGGAIGNNGGNVMVSNSNFAYNYRRTSGSTANPTAFALDDFGADGISNTTGQGVSVSYSSYQAPMPSQANDLAGNNQYIETDATPGTTGTNGSQPNVPSYFSGGQDLKLVDPTTGARFGESIWRPFLVPGDGQFENQLVPSLSPNSWALESENQGTMTRFDVPDDPNDVVMSYLDRKGSYSWLAVGTSGPTTAVGDDSDIVTLDQVGVDRPQGDPDFPSAGAAEVKIADLFQVSLTNAPGGSVSGASSFGDVYPEGTSVTVTATPDDGYAFVGWKVNGDICLASTCAASYTFSVVENVLLEPVFTQILAPSVDSFGPTTGPIGGGTTITLDGTNLAGSTVTVGGQPCTEVSVNETGTQLTCVTPPGSAGPADVIVTNDEGEDTAETPFTYTVPVQAKLKVNSVSPRSGPVTGKTTITILGTDLESSSVLIGGKRCTSLVVNQAGTRATCKTPSHKEGSQAIVVSKGSQKVSAGKFAFKNIAQIAISSGSVKGKGKKKKAYLGGSTRKSRATVLIYRVNKKGRNAVLAGRTKSKSGKWRETRISMGGSSGAYFCAVLTNGAMSQTVRATSRSFISSRITLASSSRGDVRACRPFRR